MESKKDVAVALSTPGRAISWRRAESKHVLPHARPRKKVCDQRGGGGVREQRRHRHGVGWERRRKKCAIQIASIQPDTPKEPGSPYMSGNC